MKVGLDQVVGGLEGDVVTVEAEVVEVGVEAEVVEVGAEEDKEACLGEVGVAEEDKRTLPPAPFHGWP